MLRVFSSACIRFESGAACVATLMSSFPYSAGAFH